MKLMHKTSGELNKYDSKAVISGVSGGPVDSNSPQFCNNNISFVELM